jgi:large subunit ribosomal protein L25
MADSSLKVDKREVTGKKTRFLRRQGLTPVHVFGHGIESLPLQCQTDELMHTIARKGTTRLLDITVKGEKETRSVFIREIQRDMISGDLLHVDFYQVNKSEKIRLAVPIVLTGEAPVLKLKNNIIEQIMTELEVECLPGNLPPQIEVDLSGLVEINQAIHVRDLKLKDGVAVTAPPDQIVVKASAIAEEKEAAAPVVAEAAAAEPAAASKTPAAEGEAPARAEKK